MTTISSSKIWNIFDNDYLIYLISFQKSWKLLQTWHKSKLLKDFGRHFEPKFVWNIPNTIIFPQYKHLLKATSDKPLLLFSVHGSVSEVPFSPFSTVFDLNFNPKFCINAHETRIFYAAVIWKMWKNFSHLFFSLFTLKKMVNSWRKVLFVHFLAIFKPNFAPKTTATFFLFAWDYQRLSKIFILQEKFVSS